MHIMMCPIPRLKHIGCCPRCTMYEDNDYSKDFNKIMDTNDYQECEELKMHRIYGPMKSTQIIRKSFTLKEAIIIGELLGIDWDKSKFTPEQFRKGLDVELEHGRRNPQTNVTGDNPILTGKIALAHLNEFPDYYERLSKVEEM